MGDLLLNKENKYFTMKSGYTLALASGLQQLTERIHSDETLRREIRKKMRIGVQCDTEVVSSCNGTSFIDDAGAQLVTQAFCSAISISYSSQPSHMWAAFAKLVLDAVYEATLYAAVENATRNPDKAGSRSVYLTAVGGGVFGNDIQWIVESISAALSKFRDISLEVYIVSLGHSTQEFAELLTR